MHKLMILIAAGAVTIASSAFAQSTTTETTGTGGLPSAPATESAMQSSQTTSTETQDGSKVEITPTGMVSVFNKYGDKTAAPDGPLTLKDGTVITVKDGKKV